MTVTIRMHGNLRRFLPEAQESKPVDVAEGTTVEALLERFKAEKDTWLVAVNGAVVERTTPLRAGDLVECYEPVAGGSARSVGASRPG
ncbi:MAG: MoaD/ThiS family protein [Candidatus Methylomirabilia bacterium]